LRWTKIIVRSVPSEWLISIPKKSNGAGLDLKGLESITVEFQGKYRAFAQAGGADAVSGAVTGG
jgi:hypothetical protein